MRAAETNRKERCIRGCWSCQKYDSLFDRCRIGGSVAGCMEKGCKNWEAERGGFGKDE